MASPVNSEDQPKPAVYEKAASPPWGGAGRRWPQRKEEFQRRTNRSLPRCNRGLVGVSA